MVVKNAKVIINLNFEVVASNCTQFNLSAHDITWVHLAIQFHSNTSFKDIFFLLKLSMECHNIVWRILSSGGSLDPIFIFWQKWAK